jgi:nucleotide-binding universal stress UspA family protein
MKKIMVPTDFSDEANNALAYAMDFAKNMGAEIRLINAFSMPVTSGDTPMMYITVNEIKESIIKRLKKAAATVEKKKIKVTYDAQLGTPSSVIEEELKIYKPDIIIMGIAHAGKWYGKFVGTTAIKIDDEIKCPILVIPPEATYLKLKKIALAIDIKDKEQNKCKVLKDILAIDEGDLLLLNVVPDKDVEKTELAAHDIKQNLYILNAHDITGGITDFITKEKVQLLAMVPHKHSIWDAITSFSNTEQIAFQIKIPLLLLSN